MQNIKSSVFSALLTYTALTTLVSDRIYFHHPNNFTTLPAISYFELSNIGDLYADDIEIGSEIIMQIDIWSTTSISAIALIVDTIMVSEGFARILSIDLFEEDTKIHHKSMRYRIDSAI